MRRRVAALLLPLLLVLALAAPSLAGGCPSTAPGALSTLVALAASSRSLVPGARDEAREDRTPGPVSRAAKRRRPRRRTRTSSRRRPSTPASTPARRFNDEKWEVGWFEDDHEYALVKVDPKTGEVTESWTGYQVAWEMARGYSGEFAHSLNSPFIWIPLCLLFFVGLCDWRKLRRIANLDLLVLLGFGVSHFFFNQGNIGFSVPLAYPVLVYLLARCLWIGFRGRGSGLRPAWPTMWLLIAALFLMGFRVGLNMADAGAIDVGYAGVTGAHKIVHGEPLYGDFPEDIHSGDTYGPVNYAAYVPFEVIWPYTGEWDDLPAAHGASITFDVATFILLLVLGIRIRPGPAGRRLGAILAFGWAAFPYTAYVLESDSNDALVSACWWRRSCFLAKPLWRGVTLSLATWAKFIAADAGADAAHLRPEPAPEGSRWRAVFSRRALLFAVGFAVVTVAAMLWPAIDPGLKVFYERTIAAQAGRSSPFSDLGTGRIARTDPPRDPRRDRRSSRSRSPSSRAASPCSRWPRSRRRAADRRADHPAPLVLPLHRLVLPADADRAGLLEPTDEPEPDEVPRLARGAQAATGAGTITGSIESASPDWLTSTTAPITQTSSSAVSKRVGIWVTRAPSASSIRTPRMLCREPVMPTSEMKAVPLGRTRPSAVGTWVWVPSTAATRPSRCQPIATFSLVTSAWKSTITASASSRSRIASTASKGERATFSPTPPLRLITATRIPPASTTVWPRPGLPLG